MSNKDKNYKNDEEIIKEFLKGNIEVIGNLVEKYEKSLYFFCLRIVKNNEDALEIVQKTFIQVLEKLNTLQNHKCFKTWMYKIALNICYNHIKERNNYCRILESLTPYTYYEDEIYINNIDPLEKEEEANLIREMLNSLPEKQKMAVILRVYQNLSYQEIGEILECQEVTARTHFHLGIKNLAEKFKKIEGFFFES